MMSSPRVLVISQVPPPHHGSTIMTQVFLESLDSLGVEAHLVDRRFSKTVGDVGRFSASKILKSFGLIFRLVFSLIRLRPTICVLFITNRPGSFLIDWLLTEILRLFRCPIVNYIHTSGFTRLAKRNRVFCILVRRALKSATATVCLGPSLTSDVTKFVSNNLTTIANTPYNIPVVTHRRSSQPLFLFLSNLLPEKGVKDFVRAALELCELDTNVSFAIAGAAPDAGTYDEIKHLIDHSPHAQRIKLLGKANEESKWKLLQTCHALVFPSTYSFEAQPLTIVEAMAMSLPTIAYDVGGIGDLIKPGVSGQLVPAGDQEALRRTMHNLLVNPDVLARFGAEARDRFDAQFSRCVYESRWAQVLGVQHAASDGPFTAARRT